MTGSGKTEIYIRLIEEAIKIHKTAIVLVPEISLTPQMTSRFTARFGERIAIQHSRLSQGERYDQWRKIQAGDVDVVIGVRSAVFAPLLNIGIIIIDEEHELTYKSENTPKYDARHGQSQVQYKRSVIGFRLCYSVNRDILPRKTRKNNAVNLKKQTEFHVLASNCYS